MISAIIICNIGNLKVVVLLLLLYGVCELIHYAVWCILMSVCCGVLLVLNCLCGICGVCWLYIGCFCCVNFI